MSSPTTSLCPEMQYQACVSSCGAILKSSQKMGGYPHNDHATTTPMGISCHTSFMLLLYLGTYLTKLVITVTHRVHSYVRLLMIPSVFSPAACTASSSSYNNSTGGYTDFCKQPGAKRTTAFISRNTAYR